MGGSDPVDRNVRPVIRNLAGYAPGEQQNDCIKLNTNECVWDPSPTVLAAATKLDPSALRRYPSPHSDELRQAAARSYGVDPDQILVGNGSDDCLTILYRTHLDEGDRIACPWPTYSLYDTLAGLQQATIEHVDWDEGWRLPAALTDCDAKLLFVANPNNPSGTLIPRTELAALTRATEAIVVVDEAYIDFALSEEPEASMLPLLDELDNLVVLRTFSKSYSMAGARLGLLFASTALIDEYRKVKDSYNVNVLSQAMGIAALADTGHLDKIRADTLRERQRLERALSVYGWTWPSSRANFLLCHVGTAAEAIYAGLKQRGILVRWWARAELNQFIRITVGRPDENDALLATLPEVIATVDASS